MGGTLSRRGHLSKNLAVGEGAIVSGGGSGWLGPGLCGGSTQGVWGDEEGAMRRSIVSWGLS